MGVSGCGKTSIGRLLGYELQVPFIDGDDHHPEYNITKMSQGMPLNDDDRKPWLNKLNELSHDHKEEGCVIACSALKQSYREIVEEGLGSHIVWIYLKGDYQLIYDRMAMRKDHFMEPGMLRSQFDTLEEPKDAIIIDIAQSPKNIVQRIKSQLR